MNEESFKWERYVRTLNDHFAHTKKPWNAHPHWGDNAIVIHLGSDQAVTFADLQHISAICGDTKNINFVHYGASGSEYTPSGDYCEIKVVPQ